MNFEETLKVFMDKYPTINPEHHPRRFTYAFVAWYTDFRHTEEAKKLKEITDD
jgi:hypothetical protein|tara:strand:- start:493 stop:651 length:159 start_codon:yes stop_codon:yes gene_type:complete